jgi:hypothetical protein
MLKIKRSRISADNVNVLCQRTLIRGEDFIVTGGVELVTNAVLTEEKVQAVVLRLALQLEI